MSTPLDARAEVFHRIREARASLPPVQVPRDYASGDGPAGAEVVDLLVDRLEDYRATVRRSRAAALSATVAEFLTGVPSLVLAPGCPSVWVSAFGGTVARDGDPAVLTVEDLDAPGVAVLTGCAVAVAQTGTLILDAGPDQGRRVLSLVPDHHICVVRVDQIVERLPAALRRLDDPTRPLTMISGPSATSDIELNRVEGVHGPRRLDVVIVD
ncbi:LUD domain-containing protein [Asanoa sp. WMMD1127]|uniref:LutC/YkgG family protein n=1 Tax=Asanoa sp. WMMD1127 TaxID=3016107 RepID=UPI00241775B1|nr:LUD domain-containing protein [Asanoa sp. WMMD1127]MDG4820419.1 LUD domain-containing protein [Asanoa sp. WMMD1127]